eukprot:scaffold88172_cov58-Phaeocystis_antarctica.AAC.1
MHGVYPMNACGARRSCATALRPSAPEAAALCTPAPALPPPSTPPRCRRLQRLRRRRHRHCRLRRLRHLRLPQQASWGQASRHWGSCLARPRGRAS